MKPILGVAGRKGSPAGCFFCVFICLCSSMLGELPPTKKPKLSLWFSILLYFMHRSFSEGVLEAGNYLPRMVSGSVSPRSNKVKVEKCALRAIFVFYPLMLKLVWQRYFLIGDKRELPPPNGIGVGESPLEQSQSRKVCPAGFLLAFFMPSLK